MSATVAAARPRENQKFSPRADRKKNPVGKGRSPGTANFQRLEKIADEKFQPLEKSPAPRGGKMRPPRNPFYGGLGFGIEGASLMWRNLKGTQPMKKLLAGMLIGMLAVAAGAKDETLLDDSDTWQMYTRVELSVTDINGDSATLGSLGVGWMLNDKLSLGPSATFELSDTQDDHKGDLNSFDFWYAGLRTEYTLQSWKLAHASASLFVGLGNAQATDFSGSNGGDESDSFTVLEPGVNVAVNAWDWVELGAGVSYRYVSSMNVGGYDEKDFQDWNLGIFARFTEF
jgi:hypothetical protein